MDDKVETLVDSLLEDKKTNIRLLPDVIESRLYKWAIKATVLAVRGSAGWLVTMLVMKALGK